MIPVVMSGGSGTRLWPVSRTEFPKQFCHFFDESLQFKATHLLQELGSPWTLTTKTLQVMTERTLRDLGIPKEQAIYEPFGRNTAPAVALACHVFSLKGMADEVVGFFSADQLIRKREDFVETVRFAEKIASEGEIVTLGLQPTYPATGYGYIETDANPLCEEGGRQARLAKRFCEKPDVKKAEEFLAAGGFYWNAGIFIFKVQSMVDAFANLQPEMWALMSSVKEDLSNLTKVYEKVAKDSIDYAIMEKLDRIVCIPADIGWSDVGSWEEMSKISDGGAAEVISENAKDNFVFSERDRTFAMLGVDDLIVVDTEDATLIAKHGTSQDVRKIVDQLKEKKSSRVDEHVFTYRPWGKYEILRDTDIYKSKVITVDPGQRLSYQSHDRRSEHWVVVAGEGELTLDDEVSQVKRGDYIFIPLQAKHRMKCTSAEPLKFLEVQIGDYFGEDDIVRYSDDYNRTDS